MSLPNLFRNIICRSPLYFHSIQSNRIIHQSSILGAGHAKWQNIKHVKAAKDQQKSQLYNRLIMKIKVAVGKQGGADPRLNKEFNDVIEMCRKANMPNSTIDKAVKRALEKKFFDVKVELIGPENSLLIVDAEVENRNYFRNEIRKVLKKYVGFGFANEGRALAAFEEKGVVRVRNKEGTADFNQEQAEDIAIEADAEEVRVSDDDDTVLMFIGDQTSHTKVKGYIESNHPDEYLVIENGIELLPYTRAEFSDETFNILETVIGEIGELEGVNRIYTNL
ncbi:hypothetical protein RDWZM_008264 [Blomia tropicalis]|uniref:Transcriptional regulatory protein n=1 Tax=Blomia tropicalis TaxID=40697 RepID=A0A9Q0M3A9_BLOTA|nr:hypothetical protein RDWZM_008264 [Blomia tropicalis]